ncbi:MAG: tetratricopeptide repeat protein [Pyrinomonadaceae bacterium]|nr:tetratricopeptide repeat protein [Pyrinomonadaceae bacterium]
MAFDKSKAIRAAEKHIAQGKIPAAIGEYRRIVEDDRDDFAALNTLGDLYARTGKKTEAAESFTGVAEHYRTQGFALKAIAMFKKILRLNPDDSDVAAKLAALYEGQGLAVEARAQYLSIVDAYTRAGRTSETLDLLRRVATLDPKNSQIRLRIGELAERENLPQEAAVAYAEAGERLLARREHEQALEAFTKARSLAPDDLNALSGFVSAHAALGTSDEAAQAIEDLLVARPDDVELRSMLVRAYLDAEDAPAAERATEELVRREASNERLFLDVAHLYLKAGMVDEAVHVAARAIEPLLSAREEEAVLEVLNEATARNPEQVEALRLLVRIHTWRRDDAETRLALERLVEVAEATGAKEEERNALMQLVRLAPDEEAYRERLQALGGWTEGSEAIGAGEFEMQPSAHEVPTFESFMISNDDYAETASSLPSDKAGDSSPAQFAEFEWNTVDSTSSAPDAASPAMAADAGVSFADLNESLGGENVPVDSSFAATAPPVQEQTFDNFETMSFGQSPDVSESLGRTVVGNERLESLLGQELESVDFYLAQGYTDIARDTLDMLERQYGQHAQIAERRRQLQEQLPESTASNETATATEPVTTPALEVEYSGFARYDVEPETPSPSFNAEVDQAFGNFTAGTSSDAPATPDSAAPIVNASAQTPDASSQTQTFDAGLADIFDEYRVAVEGDEPPSADYETHYNLGIAYQEMDLLDDAIEEFQKAAALAAPQDGTPRYLQCCNLLGHCFMRKGMGQIAAMWFRKGLDTPDHTEDEYQALRYELGAAYEQMGDTERAIETFTEVYGINVAYRGVSDKLRELRAQREKEVSSKQ